ncbi:MAG TPA: TIGR00282 family metallophosphoesterase [Candidatus Lustribacter sp.]|nr:TIGR00282 family metallophosphoesterase [Candidatus Lustribacter sp.]
MADVVGAPGRETLAKHLPLIREQHHVDVVIANGENAAGGFGLTGQTAEEMFAAGVDFLTSGNHIWDKREFRSELDETDRIIRPANYPPGSPGRGSGIVEADGIKVGILNVMGRVFMPAVDDPFRVAREMVEMLREQTPVVVVDVHAEATSEKMAMGRFLDGSVSFVYGSHTHVQTADEQIFSGGTAYITDVGMTGPTDGVIGMETSGVLQRFTQAYGERFSVQKTGPRQFCAALATVEVATGRAVDVKRINLRGLA